MGECKTITIQELKKDNPRLCLSTLRVFNKCYECSEYEKKIKQKDGTFKIKICESRITNPERIKREEKIKQLEKEKNKIQEEINNINQKVEELKK